MSFFIIGTISITNVYFFFTNYFSKFITPLSSTRIRIIKSDSRTKFRAKNYLINYTSLAIANIEISMLIWSQGFSISTT